MNLRSVLLIFTVMVYGRFTAQVTLDAEAGICRFGYNDVRISGTEGTLFSLSDDFKSKVSPFYRARLSYTLKQRHVISALFAPLQIKSSGTPSQTIYFQNALFQQGMTTSYTWKFNSYRLSYHYNVVLRERFTLGLGLTAKIRDAKIALQNNDAYAEKTNLGIVPLIRFYADWQMAGRWHLIADGDMLVGPQGRAEDVLFAVGYMPREQMRLKLGYRLLEGGADNDEVYNFSSVHYASLSLAWTFKK